MIKINIPKVHINKQKLIPLVKKAAIPSMFLSIAGVSTAKEYKKTIPEHKKNVLIKNIIIIASTFLGATAGLKHSKKLLPKVDKLIKNTHIKELTKDYITNFSVPVGSIIAGVLSGQLIEAALPITTKDQSKNQVYNEFLDKLDGGTIGKTFDYAGINSGGTFDTTFSTLSGFNAGKEKGIGNKLKKACYELFAGVIVPVAIIVPVTRYGINNPKNFIGKYVNNNKYKKSLFVVPIAVGCCILGNAIAKSFNQNFTDKLAKKEIWGKIEKKQQDLLRKSLLALQTGNQKLKIQTVKEIKQLNEIKSEQKT